MGWQRICLLESVLTPFMPAAEVSLTKFSRWFICIIWIFLVLISRCSFVLGLGKALGFCSLPAWFWRSHSSPCAPMPLCREEINIISWLLGMSGGCAEDEVAFRYLTCEWEVLPHECQEYMWSSYNAFSLCFIFFLSFFNPLLASRCTSLFLPLVPRAFQ